MTLTEIDADLARRLVAAQFPEFAHLHIRAVEFDGCDNRTFRLGAELSVRLPSGDWYAKQVAKEQRWLPVLAPHLPFPVPTPVAQGVPQFGYPYPWSVYRWLEGEVAATARIPDLPTFAEELARFLVALRAVDPTDGPPPGPHNFFRGGPLETYAEETVLAAERLGREVPATVLATWDTAMGATWTGDPVWFHGDVAVGNLLVRDGRLSAVIDFGTSGVGDPACDVVIAWTFFSGASRESFRRTLAVDDGTWARGRGWALWKALITLGDQLENDPATAAHTRLVIDRVLVDHAERH